MITASQKPDNFSQVATSFHFKYGNFNFKEKIAEAAFI